MDLAEQGADAVAFTQMHSAVDTVNPQPAYRALLEQGGVLEPVPGLVQCFQRADTEFVLRHHELFSNEFDMHLGNDEPLIPINVDPPAHTKYRRLLDPLFAPKRVQALEDDIARRANALIDAFFDRGECNFTGEYAELFPSSVFLDLLGLPQCDMPHLLRLRDGILHPARIDPTPDPDRRLAVQNETGRAIRDYFGEVIDRRLQYPGEDVLSQVVSAEIEDRRLSRDELVGICHQLLIAGLDTVSDTLTCHFAFLAIHPDHQKQLAADPDLVPGAVEELLRFENSIPSTIRRVVVPEVRLPSGRVVTQGTTVNVSFAAANLDRQTVEDPFEVRFDRTRNPHITFGSGVHRCLGSNLARRELGVTFREWHRRIPHYWLKPGHQELAYPDQIRHVPDLMLAWT
jgi:cytochrome P450